MENAGLKWVFASLSASPPPGFALRHVLSEPVFVNLQAQAGTLRELHDALSDHRRFAVRHLLFEAAEFPENVFDLEKVLDRPGKMDGRVEADQRAWPAVQADGSAGQRGVVRDFPAPGNATRVGHVGMDHVEHL